MGSLKRILPLTLTAALVMLSGVSLAQQKLDEVYTAPLSLSGEVSAGYANIDEDGRSAGSPVSTIDANLNGYVSNPRLLVFEFKPVVTFGRKLNSTIVGGEGDGFTAATTLLGGSAFPLTLSYSRITSNNFALASNSLLWGLETGTTTSAFGVNWELVVRNLPTVKLNYTDSNSDIKFPTDIGDGTYGSNSRQFLLGTNYTISHWDLGLDYRKQNLEQDSPVLEGVGNLSSNRNDDELRFNAFRKLPLKSDFAFTAAHNNTDYSFADASSRASYDSLRASFRTNPIERLTLSANSAYFTNLMATQVQDTLAGGNDAANVVFNPFTAENKSLNVSGGAGFRIGGGFSATGTAGIGKSLNDSAPGVPTSSNTNWSAGLNYQRMILNKASVTASYSYDEFHTDVAVAQGSDSTLVLVPFDSRGHNVSASISGMLPAQFQGSASAAFSRTETSESPSHVVSMTFTAQRPLGRWTLAGNFGFGNSTVEFPFRYENHSRTVGATATSGSMTFSFARQYNSGLSFLTPAGLEFVTNPQPILLSPLAPALSTNSNVNTTLSAFYRPTRRRLSAGVTYARYGFALHNGEDLSGIGANLINFYGAYRLRRLQFVAGYLFQTQTLGLNTVGTYDRRQVYFQVVRNFRVF